jgi:hypothetical protein
MNFSFRCWVSVSFTEDNENADARSARVSRRAQFLAGPRALCGQHLRLLYASPNAPAPRKTSPPDLHPDRGRVARGRISIRDPTSVAHGANAGDNGPSVARFII